MLLALDSHLFPFRSAACVIPVFRLRSGFCGAMLRMSGVRPDVQVPAPYDIHKRLDFVVPVSARAVTMRAALGSKFQALKGRKMIDGDLVLLNRSISSHAFSPREVGRKGIAAPFVKEGQTKANASKVQAQAQTKESDEIVGRIKTGVDKDLKAKKTKASKKPAKDSDMPKRPVSGFFVFMETFRKIFKEENPDVKGVTASAKAGGEKWLLMSEQEKAPFHAEAAERKVKYEEAAASFNKKSSSKEGEGEDKLSK